VNAVPGMRGGCRQFAFQGGVFVSAADHLPSRRLLPGDVSGRPSPSH
jgi:hypothetical protein